jgi:hypothetical protein
MKILLTILIVSTLTINNFSQLFSENSKRGTTAAQFLSIGQGARAVGMGSAYVALSDDPTALFWNPAGITKVEGFGFVADHTKWIADLKYNFLALTYNLGNFGTIGASFTVSDIDEMNVTTVEKPDGTGEVFNVSNIAFSLAWAINLTENFSIGFNPKYIYESIWRTSASTLAIDVGIQYVTPFDGIILAMSISNFGTKMQLTGSSTSILYDPNPNSSGNNPNIPGYLETDYWDLPLTFRVGLGYDALKIEEHRFTLSLDALHFSDNYESLNLGAEYCYDDFISIRSGYKSLFLPDSEETFSFGFGLKKQLIGNITLGVDYAYQAFGRLSNIQKFAISINF